MYLKSLLVLLVLLLTACTDSVSTRPSAVSELANDPQAATALEYYENGDFATAAPLLLALAERQPPAGWTWQLQAADAYLQAGEIQQARDLLAPLQDRQLNADGRLLQRLVEAGLLLRDFEAEPALQRLALPPPATTSRRLQIRYYQLKAEAYRFTGNILESANTLQLLDGMLVDEPEQRLQNQLAIIRTLSTLTDTALDLLKPSPPGIQGGWMELARIIKLYSDSREDINERVEQWRSRFTDHPAMAQLLDGYFQQLEQQYRRATHVAVLLPQSGRFEAVATAISRGILAAWFNQPAETRPALRFYDSSNPDGIWPLYTEATERGADFVIGPLQKAAVSQLLHAGELSVPVLALNQVTADTAPPQNFYQFSLSPEDEARQVAEYAWVNGKRQPIVLVPQGEWGERLRDAFVSRWQSLGGMVTDVATYDSSNNDFGDTIQALLDVDQSKERRRSLTSILGQRLEFEPRRREDIDFVFVAATPLKARQLRPQLQFHYAYGLPIYTTSHAWSGYVDIDRDRDIEGIIFPDIPWLLADEGAGPLSLAKYKTLTGVERSPLFRLTAMGIDSYLLLAHLARLQNSQAEALDGKTGQLWMDRLNQLHRQLVWAQIKQSVPEVLGYAPRLDSSLDSQMQPVDTPPPPTTPL